MLSKMKISLTLFQISRDLHYDITTKMKISLNLLRYFKQVNTF